MVLYREEEKKNMAINSNSVNQRVEFDLYKTTHKHRCKTIQTEGTITTIFSHPLYIVIHTGPPSTCIG